MQVEEIQGIVRLCRDWMPPLYVYRCTVLDDETSKYLKLQYVKAFVKSVHV